MSEKTADEKNIELGNLKFVSGIVNFGKLISKMITGQIGRGESTKIVSSNKFKEIGIDKVNGIKEQPDSARRGIVGLVKNVITKVLPAIDESVIDGKDGKPQFYADKENEERT